MTQPYITIDNREAASSFIANFQAWPDLPFEIRTDNLLVGDVQLSDDCVVEIKRIAWTANDLWSSLKDGRFHDQLEKMQSFSLRLLIIEMDPRKSPFTEYFTEKHWESMCLTAEVNYNVHLHITNSMQDTIKLLLRIWEKINHPHRTDPTNKAPKPKTLREQQQYLLSGLQDVGVEKTAELLTIFQNPMAVFEWIRAMDIQLTKSGHPKVNCAIKGFGPQFFLKNKPLLLGGDI